MDQGTVSPTVERTNERANEPRSSILTEHVEVRVRQERHRRWWPEERLRIVRGGTLLPGAVIAEVARRHGIGTGLAVHVAEGELATAMAGLVPVQDHPWRETSHRSDAGLQIVHH